MELQQLKYYLQLCEDKNYAEAAQNLFISQQALRKSIKKMEDELALTLIYRKGNSLCLTPAGECLAGEARRLLRQAEEAAERVRAAGQETAKPGAD